MELYWYARSGERATGLCLGKRREAQGKRRASFWNTCVMYDPSSRDHRGRTSQYNGPTRSSVFSIIHPNPYLVHRLPDLWVGFGPCRHPVVADFEAPVVYPWVAPDEEGTQRPQACTVATKYTGFPRPEFWDTVTNVDFIQQ